MGKRTEHAPGTFSWAELMTSDAEGAKAFYTGLFGWDIEDSPIGDGEVYTMLRVGDDYVAALFQPPPERSGQPAWNQYVTVEDADAAADRAKELGATILGGPFDVLEAGRMAVIQDPQGAVFSVWQAKESIGATLANDPGAMSLNQLNAADVDKATTFYSELFGWRFESASEEPPYWGVYNGPTLNAGMMPLPPGFPGPSHWLVYFTTTDLDASAAKIGDLGGQITVPPMPIESGRILVAQDPQGAYFALFEGEVDP